MPRIHSVHLPVLPVRYLPCRLLWPFTHPSTWVKKKMRHQNFTPPKLDPFLSAPKGFQHSFNQLLSDLSITSHRPISVNDCLQPFGHLDHLLIDEILRYRVPSLIYKPLGSGSVPVREFPNVILRRQPAIFNWTEIRRRCTVEIHFNWFSSFHARTMLFLLVPCPESPSSSNTKSSPLSSHGLTIGFSTDSK